MHRNMWVIKVKHCRQKAPYVGWEVIRNLPHKLAQARLDFAFNFAETERFYDLESSF